MKLLIFDLRGTLAHFRRPDTTATHATYPFITRTAIRGLVGSVLGMDEFLEKAWTGVRLLNPVRTCAQELSLLGKGFLSSGPKFQRPTSVELVIDPHYRIYYGGARLDDLASRLSAKQSTYHTYLGSAFALTFPEFVKVVDVEEVKIDPMQTLETSSVVPTHVVRGLDLIKGANYGRAGGMLYEYLGGRRFNGTINFLYDRNGRSIRFWVKDNLQGIKPSVLFVRVPDEGIVALW